MDNKIQTHELVSALADRDIPCLLEALNWPIIEVPVVGDAWRSWGWFGAPLDAVLVAHTPGCRVVTVQGAMQRELIVAVARQAPLETVLWFFVAGDELTLAFAQRTDAGSTRVRSLSIDPDRPDAMGLERLLMLDRGAFARPDDVDPAEATVHHLVEVLDQEAVVAAFFAGFRDALDLLTARMIDGPAATEERSDISLVVLLRLVFVYFLQREGLLDGDRRWVVRRLRGSGDEFFAAVLRPLFFGVLNTPAAERDRATKLLGDIPFLNGGLFEPTPSEADHPRLRWSTDDLRSVIEGLFERFHFTAVEPTGDDEASVVDPEMLGKVFEGLMAGHERQRSGAFYTPRDLVRRIVDRAIDAHVDDHIAEGVDRDAALQSIRILDPAVGTGAFLLEALASLRARRAEAGLPVDYGALRGLVHDHLFGVDCNRTAVRLCELRIWLVMLTAMRAEERPLAPLPNLSHRIVAGDSLLDGVDLVRRRAGGLDPACLAGIVHLEARLERVHRRFLESHGAAKATCRDEIAALERALQRALVAGRRALLERQLRPLVALETSPDLFGEPMASAEQHAWAMDIQHQLDALDAHDAAIRLDRAHAAGFGYETRFGAAAREGFDVIVTNPPWVRAQHVDKQRRNVFAGRYHAASGQLWAGAREIGVRSPYGSQPDLAALFIERSLELLRPGGRLAALIPAKLFRTLHGSPVRRLLESHAIEQIEDLSDATRQLFSATVYPGILHVRKDRRGSVIDIRVWRGAACDEFRRTPSQLTDSGVPGAPWLLVPDDVGPVIERLRATTRMLGELPEVSPCRGIFTGANDVFLRPSGGFVAELGPDVAPYVRPSMSGSGLGRTPKSEILFCYDGAAPMDRVPKVLEDYFAGHARRLQQRSDFDRRGPLWQLFRVRDDTQAPKVAWRDMSVLLDPVVVAADFVPMNTVYYAPFDDPAAAAGFARWMASIPVRAVAYALAERARGGWRRHFAWVVRMLPVPDLRGGWASFHGWREFGVSARDEAALEAWLGHDGVAVAA